MVECRKLAVSVVVLSSVDHTPRFSITLGKSRYFLPPPRNYLSLINGTLLMLLQRLLDQLDTFLLVHLLESWATKVS